MTPAFWSCLKRRTKTAKRVANGLILIDNITVKEFAHGFKVRQRRKLRRIYGPECVDSSENTVCLEPCTTVIESCDHAVCETCIELIISNEKPRATKPQYLSAPYEIGE